MIPIRAWEQNVLEANLVLKKNNGVKISPGGLWQFTMFPISDIHGTQELGYTQLVVVACNTTACFVSTHYYLYYSINIYWSIIYSNTWCPFTGLIKSKS